MMVRPLSLAAVCMLAVGLTSGAVAQKSDWQPAKSPLTTVWTKQVSPTNALPEYPRPQMVRKNWQNLNGLWDYALVDNGEVVKEPTAYAGKILVPYPLESALSGLAHKSAPNQRLWYRRTFTTPRSWKGQRIILHFGAVNWDSTVAVNGLTVTNHRGGYDPFDVDITEALRPDANVITVSAWNPLLADSPEDQVLGKQRIRPGGIFYTAATGIWQTVWIEPVPKAHIVDLKLTPDIDANCLRVKVDAPNATTGAKVQITVTDRGKALSTFTSLLNAEAVVPIPGVRLWTPESPHLYGLQVTLLEVNESADKVDSYFAMRKVSLGKDAEGRTRILLNNKFVFQVGALDQGYWPDGIYTAPTDEALRFDIVAAKKFGLNLLRKHAKVEPERWYYWADRLGMLVWQDMPQGFSGRNGEITNAAKYQFETEWIREIATHYNHPSIIVWTVFNEGWGQHDTDRYVTITRRADPTRLVNNASGWTDMHVGDIADTHAYPGPWSGKSEPTRASVCGEFGGVTMRVPGHMWTEDVFGYGATLKEGRLVTQRYQALLRKAYALRDSQGASAVVYTQLTDVEQESNGLLTYDRRITKPDTAIVLAANQGKFPPLPPNPNPDLIPTSQEDPVDWKFTIAAPAAGWMQPNFSDGAWNSAPAPFGHGLGGVRTEWTTGDIWIRRSVTLPNAIPDALEFSVFHDEDIEIYINGVLAGSAKGYVSDYVNIPITPQGKAALKPGVNVIAAHCHQTVGGQFIDVGIARVPVKK